MSPPRRGNHGFLSHGHVLVPRKRCKARGRVLVGYWVSVHGFGVSVRLRGLGARSSGIWGLGGDVYNDMWVCLLCG